MTRDELLEAIAKLRRASASEAEQDEIIRRIDAAFPASGFGDLVYWSDLPEHEVAERVLGKQPIQLGPAGSAPLSPNTLCIRDLTFEVLAPSFDASYSEFSDCLIWSLDLRCKQGPRKWRPHATVDYLLRTAAGELATWRDIAGRQVDLGAIESPEGSDDGPASLYVFEHHEMNQGTVDIRLESNTLVVNWRGVCDVFWDDTYGTALPFAAVLQPRSWGVFMGTSDERHARKELGRFMDLEDFAVERNQDGLIRMVSRSYGVQGPLP